jgi:hypothetical protein
VEATNASLLAMFTDEPLLPGVCWTCDAPEASYPLDFSGSIAEEHALGR